MYYTHFGLRGSPFQPAPSADFFFASRGHREALAALQWGLSDPTGLALLTGDVGTGKTTVIRELFSREKGDLRTALISNPRLDFDSLLEHVLRQIKVDAPCGRLRLLDALNRATTSHRVVVVIDEAQQLSDEVLEEFRLLSNSDPERLQLMLVGQPEVLERLGSPRLRQLNQRIAIRAVLNPLDPAETVEYLEHRLRAAGGNARRIFSRGALRAVVRVSQGIPRRVNIVSHNAMLSAYSSGSRRVYRKHVLAAEHEYDHANLRQTSPRPGSLWRQALPPTVLLMAAIAFRFFHGGAARQEQVRPMPAPAVANLSEQSVQMPSGQYGTARSDEQDTSGSEQTSIENPVAASAPASLAKTDTDIPAQPVPAESQVTAAASASRPRLAPSAPASGIQTSEVVVRAGDTLSGIAERYSESSGKLDVKQLVAANPEIRDANLIYPGERLRLSPKQEAGEENHE